MPETIEQHFAERPEPEKSPGQIKEEQALKLVREIKEIRGKINKQGESIEDYQRISELAKNIEALYETKERDYETEVKIIVANLRQAWEKGADRDDVAWGLAGVGTTESMKLRKELLEKGADKSDIAYGLAGVNTKEAEEFRKEYFGNEPTLFAKSYSTGYSVYDGVICQYGYEK